MAENTTKSADSELKHTSGGVTTRDDALDAGVPMLPGDRTEPVGPEDAFGPGPKRGDYTGRIDTGPHLVSVPVEDPKPGEPVAKLVPAAERASDIGDEKGVKGGTSA